MGTVFNQTETAIAFSIQHLNGTKSQTRIRRARTKLMESLGVLWAWKSFPKHPVSLCAMVVNPSAVVVAAVVGI